MENLRSVNSPCFRFIKDTLGEGCVGVEIGIWDGGNASVAIPYIKPKKYYMVDPYREWDGCKFKQCEFDSVYSKMFSKFSTIPEAVILKTTSLEASKIIENDLDFVYIDGAHDYENKILDLKIWYNKIRKGGIICGDDYLIPSVIKAVDDFAAEMSIKFEISKDSLPHPPEYWAIKEN